MIFFQIWAWNNVNSPKICIPGFVSVNPTEISVSVVLVYTRFGRPLLYIYTYDN